MAAKSRPHVLIVEDEENLAMMLRYNLEREGYSTSEAHDGQRALEAVDARIPDLILLDWMIPSISGIEVCRILRHRPKTRSIPIIMLSAKGEEADKVRGLQTGADDYVAKPFGINELLARIRSLLRRTSVPVEKGSVEGGDLVIDLSAHRVIRNGRSIHLGPTEFRMLSFLMSNPNRVFNRNELLNAVWGLDIFVEPRTVDVHIRRLRKAINGVGEKDVVRTVRGAGYSFDAGDAVGEGVVPV
ncbi:phosphate regulon transcriptional regulator PhoB [Magnetospirillum sp. 64-120]|uniref:phosphate regulon transcriptional regulator PhoB n=1 Tax=Magnetospirillum sp. 64-120 TaxID=1895778 RepID=UPI00092652FD|nr:phosphate regulon transcriptional regulator PhoB [Magnetospirillum sp. 64-120]OJX78621.1 MAG: phosphate regulon transcriptional regulatory protein PhoB [Magnetospirillum sp. 64-120]